MKKQLILLLVASAVIGNLDAAATSRFGSAARGALYGSRQTFQSALPKGVSNIAKQTARLKTFDNASNTANNAANREWADRKFAQSGPIMNSAWGSFKNWFNNLFANRPRTVLVTGTAALGGAATYGWLRSQPVAFAEENKKWSDEEIKEEIIKARNKFLQIGRDAIQNISTKDHSELRGLIRTLKLAVIQRSGPSSKTPSSEALKEASKIITALEGELNSRYFTDEIVNKLKHGYNKVSMKELMSRIRNDIIRINSENYDYENEKYNDFVVPEIYKATIQKIAKDAPDHVKNEFLAELGIDVRILMRLLEEGKGPLDIERKLLAYVKIKEIFDEATPKSIYNLWGYWK